MMDEEGYVAQLIARSTGLFGDFKLPICSRIIANERPYLSDMAIQRILKRHRQHVEFWNIARPVFLAELNEFAAAIGRDANDVYSVFDQLRWVGVLRYNCNMPISFIITALAQNGIEYTSRVGRAPLACFIQVRFVDAERAKAILYSQIYNAPPQYQNQLEIGFFENLS